MKNESMICWKWSSKDEFFDLCKVFGEVFLDKVNLKEIRTVLNMFFKFAWIKRYLPCLVMKLFKWVPI